MNCIEETWRSICTVVGWCIYASVCSYMYAFSSLASYMTYAHIASALIFISTSFFFSSVALRSLNQTELPYKIFVKENKGLVIGPDKKQQGVIVRHGSTTSLQNSLSPPWLPVSKSTSLEGWRADLVLNENSPTWQTICANTFYLSYNNVCRKSTASPS